MKLIIQDYLSQLNERDELDVILPDLLRVMGFQIVKLAFRGEVEHGVDIAAYGNEGDEKVLYLIQVKAGDIDQGLWDTGPNSVRTTLNNLLDVPFQDLSQPELQQAKRKIILAHNGYLRENIRDRFNGYIETKFSPHLPFDRWNLDRIADLVEENLLNERILPKKYQRYLKRTLVFLEVPGYDLVDLTKLLSEITPKVKRLRKKRRQRYFGFIRLILLLIHIQCQEYKNISPSIKAHEKTLLFIWGWMYQNKLFNSPTIEEYIRTFQFYISVLLEWTIKISPTADIQAGLSYARAEIVEYPMRTFKVIGNLGLLSTILSQLSAEEEFQHLFLDSIELLKKTIKNNPSSHRPLLDNHSIDIFLGFWALNLANQYDFAKWWLKDLFDHITIRKKILSRLPELYNNIDAVIEYESTNKRPHNYIDSSSTLIYMLFEFCLVFDSEEIYLKYRQYFQDIDLQIWYPPENVESQIYFSEIKEGDTEVSIRLPEKIEEFRIDVEARTQFDEIKYSPINKGISSILLLANKHHRTPVFPLWWRSIIFSDE